MRVTRTDFLGLDKMSYDELAEFAAEPADYNAELQETLQRRTKQFEGMAEMWVERGVENAKLRELVNDVYALHWNGLDCTECPWFDECDTTGGCPWLSIFADRMRELGVGVDE